MKFVTVQEENRNLERAIHNLERQIANLNETLICQNRILIETMNRLEQKRSGCYEWKDS